MDSIRKPLSETADKYKLGEALYCGICKHSIAIRNSLREVICVQTLGLHEKGSVVACEYAEHKK